LVLHKSDKATKSIHPFKALEENGILTRIKSKAIRLLKEFKLYQSPLSDEEKYLTNRPGHYEQFSFPYASTDLTREKIVQDADVIHLHWVAGLLDYPSFFEKINKKVVWTLHDMNPFTGGCHYSLGCEKYRENCDDCPQMAGTRNPSYSQFCLNIKMKALQGFDPLMIVTPSEWLGRVSAESSLFKKYNHQVIRYTYNEEVFKIYPRDYSRQVFNLPLDKNILLFVTDNLSNIRKGFQHLAGAVGRLSKEYPLILVFAGDVDHNTENLPFVRTLGRISDERLMSLAYSAADLVIVPSLEDNLPNVVQESLLIGTPVIGFPVGGIKEMIKPGINGLLTDECNANALEKEIVAGLSEVKFASALSIRENALSQLNNQLIAKEYLQLYTHFLDNHNS